MFDYSWLEELKPEDKVIRTSSGLGRKDEVRKVKRLTKTLIILDDDRRYRRRDGYESGRGSSYYWSTIKQYTEEDGQKIARANLIEVIRFKCSKAEILETLTNQQLNTIWECLKPCNET